MLSLLAPPAIASSRGRAGSTGAAFLEIGVGARAAAMGEAGVAWADDVYGLHFNPAGAARVSRKEIGFVHNNLFQDINFNYLGYLHPFPTVGTLGVGLTYVDLGSARRTTIASAATNSYLGTFSSHDLALTLHYARPVRSFLDLGVSLKLVNEKLDNQSATAGAIDLGAIWHPPVSGLSIGLSLANLGSSLQFVRERDELPLTLRAGAGYRSPRRLWGLTGEMVWVKHQDVEGRFGGEVWIWPEHLAGRIGFSTANDAGSGVTAGAGFRWDDISIDYAFTPFGDLGDAHQISLTYQFGEPRTLPGGMDRPAPVVTPAPLAPAAPAAPVAPPPLQPDYGRVEPPLSPVAGSPAPPLVHVLPFTYQSGPPGEDWIGPTLPDVIHHYWISKGAVSTRPEDARFTIRGDYWIVGQTIIVNAEILDEGWPAQRLQWRGDAKKLFLVFNAMAASLSEELARRGMRNLR